MILRRLLATAFAAAALLTTVNVEPAAAIAVGKAQYDARDYGAKGDDNTDDRGALQALFALVPAGGADVLLGPGTYKVNLDLTVPAKIRLVFTRGAKVHVTSGHTLTINGSLNADPGQQVFTFDSLATQPVVFGGAIEKVYPGWFGADPAGVVDSQPAITATYRSAPKAEVVLSAGTFKLASTIPLTSDIAYNPGPRITGAGMRSTTLDMEASGAAITVAGVTLAGHGTKLLGGYLRDFSIKSIGGVAGSCGLDLTAWWSFAIDRLEITGMKADGVRILSHPEISAQTDDYQCAYGRWNLVRIFGNTGWGINASGGLAWSAQRVQDSYIAQNLAGGVWEGGHNNTISGSAIYENGAVSTDTGGLLVDRFNGATSNGLIVEQCEFDGNYAWHVKLKAANTFRISNNRFNSWCTTWDGSWGGQAADTSVMHPATHVLMGGSSLKVAEGELVNNYHRSQWSGTPGTAASADLPVVGYNFADVNVNRINIVNPNFSIPDNTPVLSKYIGQSLNLSVSILDQGVDAFAAPQTRPGIFRMLAAQNVPTGGTANPLAFESSEFTTTKDYVLPSTATYTASSNAITLTNNLTNWAVGSTIIGSGIPNGTTLTAYNSTTGVGTLSANATGTHTNVGVFSTNISTGDITSGSYKILNVTCPTLWRYGQKIVGTGIPAGTVVTNITSTTLTISAAATATNTAVQLGNGHGYQVPYTGAWRYDAYATVAGLYQGQQVRVYMMLNGGTKKEYDFVASGLPSETFNINGVLSLTAGDLLTVAMDQSSGTDRALTVGTTRSGFSIVAVH